MSEKEKVSDRFQNRIDEYLDVALAAILVIDENGKVSLINKKGCEILEYIEQEIIGENWFDIIGDEESNHAILQGFTCQLRTYRGSALYPNHFITGITAFNLAHVNGRLNELT